VYVHIFAPRTAGCKEARDARSGSRSSAEEPRVTQGLNESWEEVAFGKVGYLAATSAEWTMA